MKKLLAIALALMLLPPAAQAGGNQEAETLYDEYCEFFQEYYGGMSEEELNEYTVEYIDQMTQIVLRQMGLESTGGLWEDWMWILYNVDCYAIGRGARGEEVVAMQEALLDWDPGCLPRYGADGDFGQEAEDAVRAFQREMGLEAYGGYDAVTKALLTGFPEDPLYSVMFYTAQWINEHWLHEMFTADVELSLEAYLEPSNDEAILANCRMDMAFTVSALLSAYENMD